MDGVKREVLNLNVLHKFINSSNNFKTNCRNLSNSIIYRIDSSDFSIEIKKLKIILEDKKGRPSTEGDL